MRRLVVAGVVLALAAAGVGVVSAARKPATPREVVRAWSAALNRNDNAAAGRLFARNAEVIQGTLDAVIPTRELATAFNATLPCAGRIVRMTVRGNRVVATFRLGHRPKHTCDGPGQEAAALFVVRGGEIVLWEQVPVPAAPGGGQTA